MNIRVQYSLTRYNEHNDTHACASTFEGARAQSVSGEQHAV